MRELQDHFHRAAQAAASTHPLVSQRISAHWMEMVQYFESVTLMKAYYRKYLTLFAGRGLPQLVDHTIMMLVMCSEFAKLSGGGGDSSNAQIKEMQSTIDKLSKTVEVFKEALSKIGELKSEVNNMKNEIKELKKKKEKFCTYCGGRRRRRAAPLPVR